MIPYADSHKTNRTPIFTILFLVVNILVFFVELTAPDIELFFQQYAFIPNTFDFTSISTWPQIFTAAFLHGGISHIVFNMLFLWVFGDNVEDELGHVGYILFYFGAIIAATLLQYSTDTQSSIPNLGASGAIAGILGYYLIRFPHHSIRTLMFFGGGLYTNTLSAQFFLGYWAITQFFNGFGSLASSFDGGVAWFAHIGGLLFGIVVGILTNRTEKANISSWMHD